MRMLAEDELREAVLLIFANKQDLPNAMNAAEITDKLGLHSLRNRNWYIQVSTQNLLCCPGALIVFRAFKTVQGCSLFSRIKNFSGVFTVIENFTCSEVFTFLKPLAR